MNPKDIVNKQTINYLKLIEKVVNNEINEKTALYYRHKIVERLKSDNKTDLSIDDLIGLDRNVCPKCLSRLKSWRIKAKPKFNPRKSSNPNKRINKLISNCNICRNVITVNGIHKQKQSINCNQKSLIKRKTVNKLINNSLESGLKSVKNKNILKNLLSSNKKKRVDQKTGLFQFLQNCTQN
jgi:hypothetical protein